MLLVPLVLLLSLGAWSSGGLGGQLSTGRGGQEGCCQTKYIIGKSWLKHFTVSTRKPPEDHSGGQGGHGRNLPLEQRD